MPVAPTNPRDQSALSELVFTGKRLERHHAIRVDGQAVRLTYSEFRSLIELVLVRARPGNGYVALKKSEVWRLRRALRRGAGSRKAAALVETGSCEEYHLAIPRREFKKRVGITPCFAELVGVGVVTNEEARRLRRICRLVDMDETEM